MSEDTICDLASLTKVVATGTAILQLVELHRLAPDDPASGTHVIIRNHVCHDGRGDVRTLRKEVAAVVETALGNPQAKWVAAGRSSSPRSLH